MEEMGAEVERCGNPPLPESDKADGRVARRDFASPGASGSPGRLAERMKKDTCFACKQKGHWALHCPARRPGGPSTAAGAAKIPDRNCRCGGGPCLVLPSSTPPNQGRKFYYCPVRQEEGRNCKFFMWCDMAACNELANQSFPICSCGAGKCRVYTKKEGLHAGREYFGCPVKKGEGACQFFQWCDEVEIHNSHSDGIADVVRNDYEENRSTRIPVADNSEEPEELEWHVVQDAFKRKLAEMNESEDSLKQKRTKTHFPEHIHFEPARLAVPEGGVEILECEQCTPPRNASKGSAEVASNVVAPGLDDDAESNLQASSPKGPKLGGPESLQLDRVDSPACKFVGAGEITEYQVMPFSPEASGARRRLAFDEDSVTTVSDKILSIIDSCLNYATSSREGTQSPITSAYSIVTLSQCLQIPENLSSEGNKIPHHRIFSNSSVRCILGLLKSTPLKDLPAIDGGIRCLLSDAEALGDEVSILKNAVDYLHLLSGPYLIKEQPPTFASMEAQFLKSRAAIEAEISRMTSECSSTATYLREAALQLENCKAIRERADLAAKALEAQLSRVQQEAIAANAKEQEAERKFQRLQESNNQMVMQLGSLVARLEGEETQHRERRAVFDAEESNRMKDLNILDEAAKVTVRLLEELQSQ